jgi:hypothetical protein
MNRGRLSRNSLILALPDPANSANQLSNELFLPGVDKITPILLFVDKES